LGLSGNQAYFFEVKDVKNLFIFLGFFTGILAGSCLVDAQHRGIEFPPREGKYLILATEAIDGDTVRFFWLVEGTARLYGINAPEMHGEDRDKGEAAKKFLQEKLPKTPTWARIVGREKYGRTLMDISDMGGLSLSKTMIDAGHAVGWDGKGKRP